MIFRYYNHLRNREDKPKFPQQIWEKTSNTLYHSTESHKEMAPYTQVISAVLYWLLNKADIEAHHIDAILDATEHSMHLMTEADKKHPSGQGTWRTVRTWQGWLKTARSFHQTSHDRWRPEQHGRLWRLLRWYDEPSHLIDLERSRAEIDVLFEAYLAGQATQADIYDLLIGPRETARYGTNFYQLSELSAPQPRKQNGTRFFHHPELREIVHNCRQRVIEIELQRGELETIVTPAARSLRSAGGTTVFCQILTALAHTNIKRNTGYNDTSRRTVLTRLLGLTQPEENYSPAIHTQLDALKLSEQQWIEAAVFAPQWATYIEQVLGWPEFASSVWWLHAHTKDNNWGGNDSLRKLWQTQVSSYTPLVSQRLLDGAVDVDWFHNTYQALGAKRWAMLHKAAKFTNSGPGHTRAKLFASAMSGELEEAALVNRIQDKRHQDSMRAFGLLPLPQDDTAEQVVLSRYLFTQEFVKTGRKFGSQRKASEKLAVEICLENLARSAGYPDPLRLQWAMERYAVADLSAGHKSVTIGETTVTLAISQIGEPEITVLKNGRELKSVPKAIKKEPEIVALTGRKKSIRDQAKRMRHALDLAMCRGDQFNWQELLDLSEHPVLRPMITSLIFVTRDGELGQLNSTSRQLFNIDSNEIHLLPQDQLRIAHPFDLFQADQWHLWQKHCFTQQFIQPFKQAFRELYIITPAEKEAGTKSLRYAGQQVHPRQALALFGQRGWITNYYDSGIQRTIHSAGLTAHVDSDAGWGTPQEIEGITIDTVYFTKRDDWKPIPLEDVPPLIFSEVMRDLDLVVSVAHQGGFDPESTASTQEMRASLVRETAALLKLDNITTENNRVLIDGTLSNYAIHLASGVVHQRPGNYVCIVPVHAQHRGRLFLPFADNDPKTAEILAKVILLARDHKIKDPTILNQLHR